MSGLSVGHLFNIFLVIKVLWYSLCHGYLRFSESLSSVPFDQVLYVIHIPYCTFQQVLDRNQCNSIQYRQIWSIYNFLDKSNRRVRKKLVIFSWDNITLEKLHIPTKLKKGKPFVMMGLLLTKGKHKLHGDNKFLWQWLWKLRNLWWN